MQHRCRARERVSSGHLHVEGSVIKQLLPRPLSSEFPLCLLVCFYYTPTETRFGSFLHRERREGSGPLNARQPTGHSRDLRGANASCIGDVSEIAK